MQKRRLILKFKTGADPGVFDIFSFDYLKGAGSSQLLKTKDEIVLNKQMADVIFGDDDPIGQTILLNGQTLLQNGQPGDMNLVVTGVYDNFPATSTFRPTALVHIDWMPKFVSIPNIDTDYRICFFQTYFRLRNETNRPAFLKQ